MPDIKIIATDLDGTFFDSHREVNQAKFKRVLDYFDQQNRHFVIATGNDRTLVDQVFKPFIGRFDYVVNNGSQVFTKKGTLLHEAQFLTPQLAQIQQIIETAQLHFTHGIIFNGVHDSYMLDKYRDVGSLYQDILWYFPKLKYIQTLTEIPKDETIVKVTFSATITEAEHFITSINQTMPNTYHATTSGYGSIDIIPAEVNKATGIAYLLDYYQLTQQQLMSFGDGLNDLEMLQASAKPKAMPNGNAYLRSHFPNAIASNDRDGVLETIMTEMNIKN